MTGAPAAAGLQAETMAALAAHAREAYPDECCGLILRRPGQEVVRRIRNMQDELHAQDPARYPRTARIAYYMDGKELLEAWNAVDREGWTLAAFYHSHPDHPAYFSQEDTERAVFDGEPLHPDAVYVVVAVTARGVEEMKAFRWDGAARAFVETPVASLEST